MSKPIEIGRFRTRLSWQSQQVTHQAGRQDVTTWVPEGGLWAMVEPLKGAELYQAAQLKATTQFKIIVRYKPIRVGDRLTLDGPTPRIFVVQSAYRLDEMNEYLVMTASELLP